MEHVNACYTLHDHRVCFGQNVMPHRHLTGGIPFKPVVDSLHLSDALCGFLLGRTGCRLPGRSSYTQLSRAVDDCWMLHLQADVHSPATTVREALYFSARCRLMGVNKAQLSQFVDQVRPSTSHLDQAVRSSSAHEASGVQTIVSPQVSCADSLISKGCTALVLHSPVVSCNIL